MLQKIVPYIKKETQKEQSPPGVRSSYSHFKKGGSIFQISCFIANTGARSA